MPISEELLQATEARLWNLVQRRMKDGADVEDIDRQIWELYGERWAVMFTDLAGFSRKAEAFGITHFLQVIYRQRELFYPIIRDHGGILIKAEADSMLLIFRTPTGAIDCAIAMQRATGMANKRFVDEDQVHLCVGIGFGEILRISHHDVWGREVNTASKLGEDTAKAGEILVTEAVHRDLGGASRYQMHPIETVAAGSAHNFRVLY